MSKQVQVVQTSSGFYIQIDGRDVDGPLSQRELIDEMRHYNNDPSYKILPPRKMNASFANGPDADRYEVKAVLLIKSDYTPQPNKTTKTVSVEASSEAEAKSKAEKLVMYGESRDRVVSVDYVSVKKLFTGYRNSSDSFTNTASYSNVKKGDRVSVKGAKKYDALSPDTVSGEVLFVHPDGKVAVRVGSGQMNVLPQDIVNAYSNGRQKAETYLNQKMAEAGVKVENIAIYVVEGTEYYGGSVFEAVEQWCRTNRKSEAKVSSPGSVAGKYEMTVGGRAVKA